MKTMSNYKIKNDIVATQGKLFGQPRWAPHFWEQAKQGLADVRFRNGFIFDITEKDVDKFPEPTHYDIVKLTEDRQGFITAEAQYE